MSGLVSVPCWLATPVANAPWKPLIHMSIHIRSCHKKKKTLNLVFDRYNYVTLHWVFCYEIYISRTFVLFCGHHIYAPFEEGGAYCVAHVGRSVGMSVCRSVGMSVGMSVALNLVQLITPERFAPEASNLVGR